MKPPAATTVLRRLAAGAVVARAGLSGLERPDRLPRALVAMAPWGGTLPGLVAAAAGRYPHRVAVRDEVGALTYQELWERSRRVATGLAANGAGPGAGPGAGRAVGLLCRNHTGFVSALVGAAATGADVVLLNPSFAGPQLADVVAAEGIGVVVHDEDLAAAASACAATLVSESAVRELGRSERCASPTRRQGRLVILTSGTTGRPKGAARHGDAAAVEGAAAVLERIPLRAGDVQVIAAPLFHAWGLSHLLLGVGRCATTVVARRFEASAVLQQVAAEGAGVLVVVPVMLTRMLAVPEERWPPAPLPLRVVASSGSALPTSTVTEALRRFGPVLYNVYGSTEVAAVSIATPADLRTAPSTAGRVAFGVEVALLDAHRRPVPDGQVGAIFAGGALRFGGYTDGADKERAGALAATGDLGRLHDGLLFVEGRVDDMIVSGGENVYPIEVEDLIASHPDVVEAAVVGAPDDELGAVLAAYVVRRAGSSLGVEDVRGYVRDRLARYKVPRTVAFVAELPRNGAGKVLRTQLEDLPCST